MEQLTELWQWAKDRFAERSTWDGGVIIGICVVALIASPIIKYVAWAGIAYGAWTIYQKEQNK